MIVHPPSQDRDFPIVAKTILCDIAHFATGRSRNPLPDLTLGRHFQTGGGRFFLLEVTERPF